MNKMPKIQWTTENDFAKSTELWTSSKITVVAEAFLKDRKAQNMADGTLYFYYYKLKLFGKYCSERKVENMDQIDSNLIREFLISLKKDHNSGGVHTFFRSIKALLRWYDTEHEPENWRNPINKVKPPKQLPAPLEPVDLEVVWKMLGINFTGIMNSDRWSAYNWLDNCYRQLCWSHLQRGFQAFVERGGE